VDLDDDHPAVDPVNIRPVEMPHGLLRATEMALRLIAAAMNGGRLVPDATRAEGLIDGLNRLDNYWAVLPRVDDKVQEQDVLLALAEELKQRNQGRR
jgi:hypothetical protein